MDTVSYLPVIWFLAVASITVTMLTNFIRYSRKSPKQPLRGPKAHAYPVPIYRISAAVGVALALLLRADMIEILKNPEAPGLFLGHLHWPSGKLAKVQSCLGIVTTGLVLSFIARFWNDFFDIVYEMKAILREKRSD